MRTFRPGQLVRVAADMLSAGGRLSLFNVPGGVARVAHDQVREIGVLLSGEVALVVWRERTVAGDVYVLGPHGGGWAPSAFLKILVEDVR